MKVGVYAHPFIRDVFMGLHFECIGAIDVAERSGIARSAIGDWKRGAWPTLPNLEAVLNVIKYSITTGKARADVIGKVPVYYRKPSAPVTAAHEVVKRIFAEMHQHRIGVSEVARRAGVARPSLQKMQDGFPTSMEVIVKVMKVLGMSLLVRTSLGTHTSSHRLWWRMVDLQNRSWSPWEGWHKPIWSRTGKEEDDGSRLQQTRSSYRKAGPSGPEQHQFPRGSLRRSYGGKAAGRLGQTKSSEATGEGGSSRLA